jgi:hypothetical protein
MQPKFKSDKELLLDLLKDAEEAVLSTMPEWWVQVAKKDFPVARLRKTPTSCRNRLP